MTGTHAILSLGLNTFIRYYSIDPSKLVGEISRRMQSSGGYDYYNTLADAVRAKASGASEDEIEYILGRSNNPSEVSHNKAAYEAFVEKFGKKRGLGAFEKKGEVKMCGGQLIVRTRPLFCVETSKSFEVYNIWAAQTPTLDRARAGVGVYLMTEAFRKSAPNYQYKMFDAVGGKTYSAVNNTIPQAVESVARRIVELARDA